MELKMKNKKEREQQILIQYQKDIQNMSIECDSDENKNLNITNIIKSINNICKDELLQNKSINTLSLNNIVIKGALSLDFFRVAVKMALENAAK